MVSSLPSSEEEGKIVRSSLNFPFQERNEVSSCRLRGKRSPLLSREVGRACLLLRWGPRLSHSAGGSSLLVGEEPENLYGAFEDWGSSVHNYPERALFSLLKIKMKTYQEVKELSSRKELSSLTKSNLD